ncbi:MAG: right-handed parallel beta-helix repeat-containing protein [Candidatus Bathyarchaeota archaeon]
MRREHASGIMLMVLLTCSLTLAFSIQPVETQPVTWFVDDDGSADFPTIQEAINAANPGDTIIVYSGTYHEHVTANKSLTLTGEDKGTTIIDGDLNGTAVQIVADSVQVSQFTIRNGYDGILMRASGNTISDNNITWNTGEGLDIENSANNVISNNLISFNDWEGVYMSNTTNTIIEGNTITSNNLTGVNMQASYDNSVCENTLGNNTKFGIRLDDSNNISVTGNTISWNEQAGINFFNLTNSEFFHNNLFNNTDQVNSDDSPNVWDNGAEGNYWSDYNGTDFYSGPSQNETGSDGLGDALYSIDANNQDVYSFMGPIGLFDAGTWDGASYNVNVASNSTVSEFQLDNVENIISFNVTGDTGLGFCRVTIPNVIIQDLWQLGHIVLVDGEEPLTAASWTDETYTYIYFTYLHSEHEVVIRELDITPPEISILSPENKAYSTKDVPLTFTVSEPTVWIGYSLNGQINVSITGNITLVDLPDGVHSLSIYANDTLGNMGSSDVVFTIDTLPPDIAILSPRNMTYGTSSISLSFTVDEPTSWIGYSLDGQVNQTVTGNTTLSGLTNELHDIIVYANDTAGNIGLSDQIYFTVLDVTPPDISVLSPENKTYVTNEISLDFAVDESVTWMAYSLDNEANVTITGNMTLSELAEGSHSLTVYANDTAGNNGASETVYFTIETPVDVSPIWWIALIIVIVAVSALVLLYFAKIRKQRKPN